MHKALHNRLHNTGFQRLVLGILLCMLCGIAHTIPCLAHTVYTNDDTGYEVIIEDDAGLLSQDELKQLSRKMAEITPYGNAAFKTIDENSYSTERFVQEYYSDTFGQRSGTVFLIDMDNRNIWIYSDGDIYKIVTSSYADTITDNVYRYASNREYFDCAYHAFEQIVSLLQGYRIAQPMKYISNALMALLVGMLINYVVIKCFARRKRVKEQELLGNIFTQCDIHQPQAVFTHQDRVYTPPSSSGGGGGGGGHGGGGGPSGGGGGHSF
ncbi:MAG: TPM domain-containing protein [Lachnospiraceae bacterium]|nr:TPM domain-containing protein [Lachnospiraceae bacterium]